MSAAGVGFRVASGRPRRMIRWRRLDRCIQRVWLMDRVITITACNDASLINTQASQINSHMSDWNSTSNNLHPASMFRFIITRRTTVNARLSMIIKLAIAILRMDEVFDRRAIGKHGHNRTKIVAIMIEHLTRSRLTSRNDPIATLLNCEESSIEMLLVTIRAKK